MNIKPLWQGLKSFPQWVKSFPQWVKISIFILLLLVPIAVFIYFGYRLSLDWTGFNSQTGTPLKPNQPFSPGKTLWDWLQLFIIPLVLFVGGFSLNYIVSRNQQKNTNDDQSDTVLRDYLDKISDLLLTNNLKNSKPNDEVQVEDSLAHKEDSKVQPKYSKEVKDIARVRTLLALRNLDPARKASLLLFLSGSGFIKKEKGECVVNLEKADFSRADLNIAYLSNDPLKGTTKVRKKWQKIQSKKQAADLQDSNLSGAIFIEAKLSYANLNGADLSQASLHEADLSYADLNGAILKEADLDDTHLNYADLNGADLSEVDLKDADLSNAKLYGANLTGAKNLKEAKLKGTKYNTEKIKITRPEKHEHSIMKTQWPGDFKPGGTPDNKEQECTQEECELIAKYLEKRRPDDHLLPQS